MADIFRKKSLDKLSSPEQLDKMIVINSPMVWLALAGGAMIIIAALIWGILGRIPITETGKGVLLRQGTVSSVYSGTQGVITKTYVSSGDEVREGDVLYEVQSQEAELAIQQLQERIQDVEAVTYYSVNDVVTSDNQSLINIKNQKSTLPLENEANVASLTQLRSEYYRMVTEVNGLKAALDAAESAYYSNIASDTSSPVSYEYEVAYSEYQAAESAYQSALAQATSASASAPTQEQMDQAQATLSAAEAAYNASSEKAALDQAKEELSIAQAELSTAQATWIATACNHVAAGTPDTSGSCASCDAYSSAITKEATEKKELEAAQLAHDISQVYNTKLEAASLLSQLQSAQSAISSANSTVSGLKSQRDSKKSVYDEKKAAYDAHIASVAKSQAASTEAANNYSRALSEYNTARAALDSLEMELKTMEVTVDITADQQMVQEESLQAQFDASKAAILDEMNQQLTDYLTLTEGQQIKAPTDGVVYSTFVTNGSSVAVDHEVARISSREEGSALEAVYFLPLDSGKNIKEGMTVNIYPNTLPKEEYGHMTGEVVAVADYVTSYADLFTRLGEETMANTFTKEGAVVEITCRIDADEATASGYAWSSKKGGEVLLTEGTLLSGNFVVEDVPPITMLIPKLKEMFHLE